VFSREMERLSTRLDVSNNPIRAYLPDYRGRVTNMFVLIPWGAGPGVFTPRKRRKQNPLSFSAVFATFCKKCSRSSCSPSGGPLVPGAVREKGCIAISEHAVPPRAFSVNHLQSNEEPQEAKRLIRTDRGGLDYVRFEPLVAIHSQSVWLRLRRARSSAANSVHFSVVQSP
jgi:hypothetical protein